MNTGALHGLCEDKAPETLLRTFLIHLGCRHSLRETVVRARQANLAGLSDVALLSIYTNLKTGSMHFLQNYLRIRGTTFGHLMPLWSINLGKPSLCGGFITA